jgi:hypothetical protein
MNCVERERERGGRKNKWNTHAQYKYFVKYTEIAILQTHKTKKILGKK